MQTKYMNIIRLSCLRMTCETRVHYKNTNLVRVTSYVRNSFWKIYMQFIYDGWWWSDLTPWLTVIINTQSCCDIPKLPIFFGMCRCPTKSSVKNTQWKQKKKKTIFDISNDNEWLGTLYTVHHHTQIVCTVASVRNHAIKNTLQIKRVDTRISMWHEAWGMTNCKWSCFICRHLFFNCKSANEWKL